MFKFMHTACLITTEHVQR